MFTNLQFLGLGWSNNSGGQYRGQYPGGPNSGPPGWGNNSRPGTAVTGQWPPGGAFQPGWAPPQPRPPRPQLPSFRPSHDPQQPPNSQSKQYPPIAPPPGLKVLIIIDCRSIIVIFIY